MPEETKKTAVEHIPAPKDVAEFRILFERVLQLIVERQDQLTVLLAQTIKLMTVADPLAMHEYNHALLRVLGQETFMSLSHITCMELREHRRGR